MIDIYANFEPTVSHCVCSYIISTDGLLDWHSTLQPSDQPSALGTFGVSHLWFTSMEVEPSSCHTYSHSSLLGCQSWSLR